MAEIVTETNCIRVDDALIPKNTVVVNLLPYGVRLTSVAGKWSQNIRVEDSTIDGVVVVDNTELYEFFLANGFFDGGSTGTSGVQSIVAGTNVTVDNSDPKNPVISSTGGGGGGIQSVTGDLVDDTDPLNPVVVAPTFEQVEGKPTTLSGYGITDAATDTELTEGLAGKQNTLTSMTLSEANTGTGTTPRSINAIGLKAIIEGRIGIYAPLVLELPTVLGSEGQILRVNGTDLVWADVPSGGAVTAADITDATTIGRDILKGLDEATIRTLLQLGTLALINLPVGGTTGNVLRADGTFGLIGSGAIQDGSIQNIDINASAAISATKLANSAGTDGLGAGTVQATLQAMATRIAALEAAAIVSDPANTTAIDYIRTGTQVQIDAIDPKLDNTIYLTVG